MQEAEEEEVWEDEEEEEGDDDSVLGACNHFCLPCRHISPPLCQAALRSAVTLQKQQREEEGGRLLSWTRRPIG